MKNQENQCKKYESPADVNCSSLTKKKSVSFYVFFEQETTPITSPTTHSKSLNVELAPSSTSTSPRTSPRDVKSPRDSQKNCREEWPKTSSGKKTNDSPVRFQNEYFDPAGELNLYRTKRELHPNRNWACCLTCLVRYLKTINSFLKKITSIWRKLSEELNNGNKILVGTSPELLIKNMF